jgi:ABC-2 type transport system ATP-binding protein
VKALASQSTTIIYTSHYMEEVELLCDRVCIMDEGKIIAAGTKDEITSSFGGGCELSLKLAKPDAALCDKLAAMDEVKKLSAQDDMVFIVADDADKATHAVLDMVNKSNASLLSFETKKASLETVFLNLTGRALRD